MMRRSTVSRIERAPVVHDNLSTDDAKSLGDLIQQLTFGGSSGGEHVILTVYPQIPNSIHDRTPADSQLFH